jgi:hypothetical protein
MEETLRSCYVALTYIFYSEQKIRIGTKPGRALSLNVNIVTPLYYSAGIVAHLAHPHTIFIFRGYLKGKPRKSTL